MFFKSSTRNPYPSGSFYVPGLRRNSAKVRGSCRIGKWISSKRDSTVLAVWILHGDSEVCLSAISRHSKQLPNLQNDSTQMVRRDPRSNLTTSRTHAGVCPSLMHSRTSLFTQELGHGCSVRPGPWYGRSNGSRTTLPRLLRSVG